MCGYAVVSEYSNIQVQVLVKVWAVVVKNAYAPESVLENADVVKGAVVIMREHLLETSFYPKSRKPRLVYRNSTNLPSKSNKQDGGTF